MRKLFKFLALNSADRLLLLRCLAVVSVTRGCLSALSYETLRRLMNATAVTARAKDANDLRRIAWGVASTSRVVPGATCLTQVMAAKYLLARAGHSSTIRIGVAKGTDGEFLAHAWLMSDDRVVLGGSSKTLERYVRLADLEPS